MMPCISAYPHKFLYISLYIYIFLGISHDNHEKQNHIVILPIFSDDLPMNTSIDRWVFPSFLAMARPTGPAQAFRQAPKLPRGGILADDMGLGKTITTIALLLGWWKK